MLPSASRAYRRKRDKVNERARSFAGIEMAPPASNSAIAMTVD
jgi:hypothetical protein